MKKLLLISLLIPSLSLAHHGISNFNLNVDVAFTGTIKEIAFVNPHSWIYVDVPDDNGLNTQWKCELRGATVLRRSGWSKEMFDIGSAVTITGSPDRFEDNTCYMGTIIFEDGSSMDRYGQMGEVIEVTTLEPRPLKRLANGDPIIAGDWAAEQGVMTDPRGISGAFMSLSSSKDFEAGEVPVGGQAFPGARGTSVSLADNPVQSYWVRSSLVPLTEAGHQALVGFDGASTDNPRLRCEPTNILFDWTFDTMVNSIEQSESEITLHYGFMGLTRTIHLDQTEFPDNLAPSVTGYSLGYWENDVLVVRTKGFLAGVLSADATTMHSEQMRVVERFKLNPDNTSLTRDYIVEDTLFFKAQHKGRDTIFVADIAYEPSSCEDLSYRSDL